MSESCFLIRSCAPVFMGVKPSAYIRLGTEDIAVLGELMQYCPMRLRAIDDSCENPALIYIPQLLERAFRQPGVQYFLQSIGYGGAYVEDYVRELVRRIQGAYRKRNFFPHEIGIFLGYPLEDVLGFWLSQGRHAKMQGAWKVYSDIGRAAEIQYFYREAVRVVDIAVHEGYTLKDVVRSFWQGCKLPDVPASDRMRS